MANWHYLNNQFENATRGSFKTADILISDHYAKLNTEKQDADILVLFNRFSPIKAEWDKRIATWLSTQGIYKGETNRFETMLKELGSTKISQWDAKVQAVHLEKTSDYIAVLPNGRAPFQNGSYERRLAEVDGLLKRLENYPALKELKKDVETFYAKINSLRDVQQSKEIHSGKASDELEEQRILITTMMYSNLGGLMSKFADAPQNVERFFELSILRNKGNNGEQEEAGLETESRNTGEQQEVVSEKESLQ